MRADDVDSENIVRISVDDDLGQTFGFAFDHRLAIRHHRELADHDLVAKLFSLLFRKTDGTDLRVAVGAGRHIEMIEREGIVAGDMLPTAMMPW